MMAIDPKMLAAYADEWNRRATFDGLVGDLERICRREWPPDEIPTTATPAELVDYVARRPRSAKDSKAWFAKEILDTIGVARHFLRAGQPDVAMAQAVIVGVLAAGAGFLNWTAYREKQAARSRTGAETKRDDAARDNAPFRAAVKATRRQHPADSPRQIARRLLTRYGRSGDRTKALDALTKRIARL
jgi:hypothetical protein